MAKVEYQDLSTAQIAFETAAGGPELFLVTRYRGTEGFCQLYRFEVELTSTAETVEFDQIVGKPAVLSINTAFGPRWFHGIVSRFELTGETVDQMYYRAELVPSLWLLTHRYNSRIFQNKSTKEIIESILVDAGIASDRFSMAGLQGTYNPREYCVQYRETDYHFICRLMEQEGIRWYFEQTAEAHKLILADSGTYEAISGTAQMPYHPPTGMNVSQEHVYRFRMSQCVRPGAVVLNDFSFANPSLDLKATGNSGRDAGLEFSDYPGNYLEATPGTTYAGLRAEEFESSRVMGVGLSNSPRVMVGKTLELTEHPSTSMNKSYLVTAVLHQGKQSTTRTATAGGASTNGHAAANRSRTQWLYHSGHVSTDPAEVAAASGISPLHALSVPNLLDDTPDTGVVEGEAPLYDCRFECIPSDVTFRPPRITRWPKVFGTQTARVVGPSGEEIHCDEWGRIKLQFNWDRERPFDDTASCWIRVSQGMAGGSYGMMFLPRVGQEVVVDFLEGDPDRPIVVGRVYNQDHMPPYKLPDEKTKSVIKTHSSTGGGGTNEVRFEDLKDSEQILINAQKDFQIRVGNDHVENIGHDHHLSVKENKFELVEKASNREIKLDLNEKVGGNVSTDVAGDMGVKTGGKYSLEAGGDVYIKAGGKLILEGTMEVTVKAGGNFVKMDPSGVTILGTMVKVNSGGAAGTGTAVTLTAPEPTVEAVTVEPGADTTYSGSGTQTTSTGEEDKPGSEFEPSELERDTSWVEIELIDEVGDPVPYESYEVVLPNGNIRKGALSMNGRGYIPLPAAEEVQVGFPNMDADAWVRDEGAPPPPAEMAERSPPPDRAPTERDTSGLMYSQDDDEDDDLYSGLYQPGDDDSDADDESNVATRPTTASRPQQQRPPRRNPYKR